MFCTNCGAQLPDDAEFCTNCGHRVERPPVEHTAQDGQTTSPTAPDGSPTPASQHVDDVTMRPLPEARQAASQAKTHSRTLALVVAVCALAAIAVIMVLVLSPASPINMGGETSGTVNNQTTANVTGGTSNGSADPGVQVDASVSTPIGNLANGGYVCEDDDNIYYTTPVRTADEWLTDGIVRKPKDGSAEETIYTTGASSPVVYHLNVTSGRVIFTEVGDGITLVKSVGTDGSNPQTLASGDDSSLVQVYEGRVYYVLGGTLRVMDPDGDNSRDIMSVQGQLWRVANDKIIHFASRGATSVSMADLDGSDDHTFISTSVASNNEAITNVLPTTQGTYVVLVGLADEGGGYYADEYDSDGSRHTGLVAEAEGGAHINRLNPTRDGVIMLYDYTAPPVGSTGASIPTDEDVIFEPESSGDHNTLFHTGDASVSLLAPTYIDGYVYIACVRSGNNVLLRIPVNGGTVETVV